MIAARTAAEDFPRLADAREVMGTAMADCTPQEKLNGRGPRRRKTDFAVSCPIGYTESCAPLQVLYERVNTMEEAIKEFVKRQRSMEKTVWIAVGVGVAAR